LKAEQAMAHYHQHELRSGYGAELAWLSSLIASLDQLSESDDRAVACDAAVLRAVQEQLARPVPWLHHCKCSTRN
jgi:hypothetical protein